MRDNALNWFERQAAHKPASANARELFGVTYALFCQNRPQRPVRSLGVRAAGLTVMENLQLSLLPDEKGMQRQENLERAVDALRKPVWNPCHTAGHYAKRPFPFPYRPQT